MESRKSKIIKIIMCRNKKKEKLVMSLDEREREREKPLSIMCANNAIHLDIYSHDTLGRENICSHIFSRHNSC